MGSDLLLRHRQKIHDQDKHSRQARRQRSQSPTSILIAAPSVPSGKANDAPRRKRRGESIAVTPLDPLHPSLAPQTSPSNASAVYMPASAPATTTSFLNFNYPSPSSTSPSSTGPEFMDYSLSTNYVNPADLFSASAFSAPQNFPTPASTSSNSSMIPPTPPFATYVPS